MEGEKGTILNKKHRKAVMKALKSVEKMMQEEPHPIVISDGDGCGPNNTVKEINGWLFHRSNGDDSKRIPPNN
jgi:hypothetical protein